MKPALTGAVLATAITVAAPLEAATYTITYTGTVGSGIDGAGLFGGGDLSGRSVTAIYTLTAPLAGADSYDTGQEASIYGGASNGTASPISAIVTIGGVSFANSGAYYSQAYQADAFTGPNTSYDQVYHTAEQLSSSATQYVYSRIYSYIYSFDNNIVSTSDYTAPLSYTARPGDVGAGAFTFERYDRDPNSGAYFNRIVTDLQLTTSSVIIAPLAATVPEPSAWALLILGFGAVGAGLRRKAPAGTKARAKLTYA